MSASSTFYRKRAAAIAARKKMLQSIVDSDVKPAEAKSKPSKQK